MTENHVRAVRFDRYGGLEELYVADVPMPEAAAGEAVVAVRAAGIISGETAIRTGALHDIFPATFPSGQGSDLAGVVAAVGPDVDGFAVGIEVLGYSWGRSSHATHAAVPVGQLIPKRPQLRWEAAGALFVAGSTAWAAVRAVDPRPGETSARAAPAGLRAHPRPSRRTSRKTYRPPTNEGALLPMPPPDGTLDLPRRPSPRFPAALMPDGSPRLTRTRVTAGRSERLCAPEGGRGHAPSSRAAS